jgi:hypothetical protein
MIPPISVPIRSFAKAEPRFSGGVGQERVESSTRRELSQEVTRFLPSLPTIGLAGITLVGGAVASQHANIIAGMNKQIVELTKQLSTLPLSNPMGWGQWIWEKVAVPGGVLGLGSGVLTFFLQRQAIINLKSRVGTLGRSLDLVTQGHTALYNKTNRIVDNIRRTFEAANINITGNILITE